MSPRFHPCEKSPRGRQRPMPPPSNVVQSDSTPRLAPPYTARDAATAATGGLQRCRRRALATADVKQSRRRCEAVPAQMWASPGADVKQSRRRCEAVPAQMWASPGADVNQPRRTQARCRGRTDPGQVSALGFPTARASASGSPMVRRLDRRKGRREGSGDGPVPYPCGHRDAPVPHALGRVPLHHAARSIRGAPGGPAGAAGGWDARVGERMDGSELRARGKRERKRGAC
jgi:hypothetical protein